MTEVEILLLVVAAIYLSECLIWLPARCQVLTGAPGRMRCAAAPDVLGNEHKRLFVLNLLPTTTTLVARHPGCLFCDEGLLLESPDRTWQLLSFHQITGTEVRADGDRVLIGEHRFVAGSPRAARQQARLIQRLTSATEARPLLAARLQRYTDPDRVERRIHVIRERLLVLHQLQFMLLVWTLGAGTFLYYFSAAPWQALLQYLLITFAIWVFTVGVAWCCHRKLRAGGRIERLKELFFSCVSPMHAVRATDRLSLNALGDEHPLTVAIATLPKRRLELLAQQHLAEMRHPLTFEMSVSGDSSKTLSALCESRRALADALSESLARKGIDVGTLLRPDQQDADAVCWCPRCFNQYIVPMVECPSCPGVTTRSFLESPLQDSVCSTEPGTQ